MDLYAGKKYIDTRSIRNLLTTGEHNADQIKIHLPLQYGKQDLSDCRFILRCVNVRHQLIEQMLPEQILGDEIVLHWTITEDITAVSGTLYLELRGVREKELVIKYFMPPIYVRSSPCGDGLPSKDVIEAALNQLQTLLEASKAVSGKPPKIKNGTWWLYDLEEHTYLDSGIPAVGASAYEIAVANGFEGSETEWLESLQCKDADLTEVNQKIQVLQERSQFNYNEIASLIQQQENWATQTALNSTKLEIDGRLDALETVSAAHVTQNALTNTLNDLEKITVYLNAVSGSDHNDGRTAAKAMQTLSAAVAKYAHCASIRFQFAAGDYPCDTLSFENKKIAFVGSVTGTTTISGRISVVSCTLTMSYLTVSAEGGDSIVSASTGSHVYGYRVNFTSVDGAECLRVVSASQCYLDGSVFSIPTDTAIAVRSAGGSLIGIGWCTIPATVIASTCGTIHTTGCTITAQRTETGGIIFINGVLRTTTAAASASESNTMGASI